jgi:hypothetical protein
MGRDRAAYMREYRKRKRLTLDPYATPAMMRAAEAEQYHDNAIRETSANRAKRIAELEEEVRHLKAELAKRPTPPTYTTEITTGVTSREQAAQDRFNTRPFTPVPKKHG